MLRDSIPNWQDQVKLSVKLTREYLNFDPKAWTKPKPISNDLITKDITDFFNQNPSIKKPGTVADELVSDLLEIYCKCNPSNRESIKKQYNQQKQIEMHLGVLLEFYLLKNTYKFGWVQTGNCLRAIDMIKKKEDGSWFKLQIKNSDNTTNSSSAGFIKNKAITWQRRNSKKGTFYWDQFPDKLMRSTLSEEKFSEFVISNYSGMEEKELEF